MVNNIHLGQHQALNLRIQLRNYQQQSQLPLCLTLLQLFCNKNSNSVNKTASSKIFRCILTDEHSYDATYCLSTSYDCCIHFWINQPIVVCGGVGVQFGAHQGYKCFVIYLTWSSGTLCWGGKV
eukprot:m.7757 g.7757  ORF g.7757 m.7757 type:complete len:124 (+) comp5285_c0_seq1:3986-4357(+)